MYRLSSLATAMFFVGVQPASADMILTLQMPSEKADIKESAILGVDRHDVLLLDVSHSMDNEDIAAMLSGVARHYSSDEAIADYKAGLCTANTIVFYGERPYAMDTAIICDESDVGALSFDLDSTTLFKIRFRTGLTTNLVSALNAASIVFEKEASYGISSGMRSVVVVGDQIGGDDDALRASSSMLTDRYSATVSAISIRDPDLTSLFKDSVCTPEDFVRAHYIRPGIARGASTSEEVRTILQTVLAFQRG